MRSAGPTVSGLLGALALVVAACGSDPVDLPSAGTGGSTATTATTTSTTSTTSASSSGAGGLPETFEVTGVVTDGTDPIAGAIVMQGGGAEPLVTTGADGTFTVTLTTAIPGTPAVVASKAGYRTRGEELLELPTEPITIPLRFVKPPDNPGYTFGPPGVGNPIDDNSTLYCGHCHTTFVAQFRSSAHAKAAKDPLVWDLYTGVTEAFASEAACTQGGGAWRTGLSPGSGSTAASKCYVGDGVLSDLNPGCGSGALACDAPGLAAADQPTAFGGCADCHAPGIDGALGGRSLLEATGVAYDAGNHCDVCHHVRDVDPSKPPGVAGRLVLQRPIEKVYDGPNAPFVQVMYGPLLDTANEFMGGSPQPQFSTSVLCSGCHEQKQAALVPGTSLDPARWPDGLDTHSTYSEWKGSSFDTPGTPCQFCHMPNDDTGLSNSVDVTDASNAGIVFGFVHPPEQIRKHTFRGPLEGTPRFIDGALATGMNVSSTATELVVDVGIQNVGAGHAIPTGEPMRALVLVVQADACGPLAPSGGMTVPDAGGEAARGVVGADAAFAGASVTWAAGAARAKAGDVVRVVRDTGAWDDYAGIGLFADPLLPPDAKGMPVLAPVGEAVVTTVGAGSLTLGAALPVLPGDVVLLGDALGAPADGDPARAYAGAPGYAFARVTVDAAGARLVPHHRAVDLASDNRIGPQATASTTHAFALPGGCASATATATLIYRPVPVALARERGWDARDWVVATMKQTVALP